MISLLKASSCKTKSNMPDKLKKVSQKAYAKNPQKYKASKQQMLTTQRNVTEGSKDILKSFMLIIALC